MCRRWVSTVLRLRKSADRDVKVGTPVNDEVGDLPLAAGQGRDSDDGGPRPDRCVGGRADRGAAAPARQRPGTSRRHSGSTRRQPVSSSHDGTRPLVIGTERGLDRPRCATAPPLPGYRPDRPRPRRPAPVRGGLVPGVAGVEGDGRRCPSQPWRWPSVDPPNEIDDGLRVGSRLVGFGPAVECEQGIGSGARATWCGSCRRAWRGSFRAPRIARTHQLDGIAETRIPLLEPGRRPATTSRRPGSKPSSIPSVRSTLSRAVRGSELQVARGHRGEGTVEEQPGHALECCRGSRASSMAASRVSAPSAQLARGASAPRPGP